jgi:hypothetical protein
MSRTEHPRMLFILILISALAVGSIAFCQTSERNPPTGDRQIPQKLLDEAPDVFRNQFLPRHPPPGRVTKIPGHYTESDWQAAIDSTWGPGVDDNVKATAFNDFWVGVDEEFACFHNLQIDWDSVWNASVPLILASGVSRGRFAGMLGHAARILKEGHTIAFDEGVSFTEPEPGVPLMFAGGWGENGHFGAGLTPLPDSSLLVYKAIENHPLGLLPGDIVLGYDGIPWKRLYPELLDAQLPLSIDFWWGSSESAHTHSWLMAAGLNWHLFDTIDIVKYGSDDTLHLATSALAGRNMSLSATEQMDIDGVPMPDYYSGRMVSWGVVEGTRIGYIYCLGWFPFEVWRQWESAIDTFVNHIETDGLIIDFRTNYGGCISALNPGLRLLFDSTLDVYGVHCRGDPEDHYHMIPSPVIDTDYFVVYGDPATSYDKPIALLTGPGCLSAGDYTSLLLTHHSMVKVFGKPTTGSFNSAEPFWLGGEFYCRYAKWSAYLKSHPGHYLTRDEFPSASDFPWVPYEDVWLTREGVAQGRDDVVEAAMAWINSCTDVIDEREETQPGRFALLQNSPNPFNAATTIEFTLPVKSQVKISIYNVLGREVRVLAHGLMLPGRHAVKWAGRDEFGRVCAGGVYFCRMRVGDFTDCRKMLLIK